MHAGAGRPDTLRMYCMGLCGSAEANGTASLEELFNLKTNVILMHKVKYCRFGRF